MGWFKKAISKIFGGGGSSPATVTPVSTPAVSVSAPAVSAPNADSAVDSTVKGAAEVQNSRAKGKRKLTINNNVGSGIGVNL